MKAGMFRTGFVVVLLLTLGACVESQSVLSATGRESSRVLVLAIILFAGGTAVLIVVTILAAIAVYGRPHIRRLLGREAVIVVGGIGFPVVVLTALLFYGYLTTSAGRSVASSLGQPVRITVVGEQWWWRVIYEDGLAGRFESANEIRIPTGRQVEITLVTADVIHSFWVPNLAGKVDMIPGRANILHVIADQPGLSRGQCAEYCGGAHAFMSFYVLALDPTDFDRWFATESRSAASPDGPAEQQGLLLFLSSGCKACHTIRGTDARGTIGPDLTHIGSRHSLAAGTLPNTRAAIAAWIVENQHLKPDNKMPPFGIFSESELSSLSSYLARLK